MDILKYNYGYPKMYLRISKNEFWISINKEIKSKTAPNIFTDAVLLFIPYLWISKIHFWISIIHFWISIIELWIS